MKRFVMQAIAVFSLVLGGFSQLPALDKVEYKALIEKDKIEFGQSVQYLIRVNFATTTMKPAVAAPSFEQFRVLNEQETVKEEGEGKERYKVYRKIWLLQPIESGNLSIASAIVTYQDPTTNLLKNGKTDIVFLEVIPTEESKTGKTTGGQKGQAGEQKKEPMDMKKMIFFGGVAAVIIIVVVLLLVKSNAPPSGPPPEDNAQLAMQKAIARAEQDDMDGYYKQLSHALFDYLNNKFEIDAHVIPTEEVLRKLGAFNISKKIMEGLDYYFKAADQAKFGGYNPDEDELIKLHGIVEKFIENGRSIKIKKKKVKLEKTDDE